MRRIDDPQLLVIPARFIHSTELRSDCSPHYFSVRADGAKVPRSYASVLFFEAPFFDVFEEGQRIDAREDFRASDLRRLGRIAVIWAQRKSFSV